MGYLDCIMRQGSHPGFKNACYLCRAIRWHQVQIHARVLMSLCSAVPACRLYYVLFSCDELKLMTAQRIVIRREREG